MESFDYRLRPAKSIERKMLAETFSRLFLFDQPDQYQYVGFGALWFNDFSLFHKTLGFDKMVSIEREESLEERFKFNCPLSCIDLRFGQSDQVLPTLNWDKKTVLWLDYTGILNRRAIRDISLAGSKMVSGSILLMTINVESWHYRSKSEKDKSKMLVTGLKEHVGEERVPAYVSTDADITGWNIAEACRQIFTNLIGEKLNIRNKFVSNEKKLQYKQLFNFRYSDNAKMATFGGVIFSEKDSQIVEMCAFEQFDFFREDRDHFFINPPLLTFREKHALEKVRHSSEKEQEKVMSHLTKEDRENYFQVHRYYPTFTEAEI